MINIYKNVDNGLELMRDVVTNCWINMVNPTPEELSQVSSFGIPPDFLTYSMDADERPRTEREDDGTMLILLKVATNLGQSPDIPYSTATLGIILTDRYIITVCKEPIEILHDFSTGKIKGLRTGKRNRFVLRLLLSNAAMFLNYLKEINKMVDHLEDRLQESMKNKELLELLKYQKSLVYFTTALKSNELMMERLKRGQFFNMYPDDEDLLEDVLTENQQAIEMTSISTNILNGMMDAFASIISNNLNVVMKFLTSVTIVLALPTLITSFYGMNVALPFDNTPMAYLLILGICLAAASIIVLIFFKRDWF
jgi:magnesium transporter